MITDHILSTHSRMSVFPPVTDLNDLDSKLMQQSQSFGAIQKCQGCGNPFASDSSFTLFRSTIKKVNLQADEGCLNCLLFREAIQRYVGSEYHGTEKGLVIQTTASGLKTLLIRLIDTPIIISLYLTKDSPFASSSLKGWPIGFQIPNSTSSQQSLSWSLKQLDRCSNSHTLCSSGAESQLPRRLIDISGPRIKLVQTQEKQTGQYICLSHCWGNLPLKKTVKRNLATYRKEIPWDNLPLTFQESINFTRNVGISYLWIDGLCIIQDDEDDWREEAAKMASIFSGSYLTISASKASNAAEGLFNNDSSTFQSYNLTSLDRDGISQGICARLFPKHLEIRRVLETISKSTSGMPIFKRGWILQERILSPRVLHFGPQELYWECLEESFCECSGMVTDHIALPELSTQPKLHHNVDRWSQLSEVQLRRYWHHLVEEYSSLSLSKDKDIFPAISGLAKEYNRVRKSLYLGGLWNHTFLYDLLWHVDLGLTGKWSIRRRPWRAPTWSWASVEGCVRFSKADDLLNPCEVLNVTCLPYGIDPMGELRSGSLTIRASIFSTTFSYRNKGSESQPWNLLVLEAFEGRMGNTYVDFDTSIHGLDHLDTKSEVYCMCIGHVSRGSQYFLLLKQHEAYGDAGYRVFERIGMVEAFQKIEMTCPKETIKIL